MSLVYYCCRNGKTFDSLQLSGHLIRFFLEENVLYFKNVGFQSNLFSTPVLFDTLAFTLYRDIEEDKIYIVTLKTLNEDKNSLQVHIFPCMECVLTSEVSKHINLSDKFIIKSNALREASNVEFDIFIDDIVHEVHENVYLTKISEFDPYDKLNALVAKNLIKEAREFAISKNLDQKALYQAELRILMESFQETESEYKELIDLLDHIEISDEVIFDKIFKLYSFPSPKIFEIITKSLSSSSLLTEEYKVSLEKFELKFNCFMTVFTDYDKTKWSKFYNTKIDDIFREFMMSGEFAKAVNVWSHFKNDLNDSLDQANLSLYLEEIMKFPVQLDTEELLQEVIKSCILPSIIPDNLLFFGQLVDIIDRRMSIVESVFQPKTGFWPSTMIDWLSELLAFFNSKPIHLSSDKTAQIKHSFTGLQSETGFEANPLDKLIGIIEWMKIIKLLGEEYAIKISYSAFSSFKPESIAKKMVLQICHLKGCHLDIIGDRSLNEFLTNNQINFKDLIFRVCKEILDEYSESESNTLSDDKIKILTILINIFDKNSSYRLNLLRSFLSLLGPTWNSNVHELFLNTLNSIIASQGVSSKEKPEILKIEMLFNDKSRLNPFMHIDYRCLALQLGSHLKNWSDHIERARRSAIINLINSYNIGCREPLAVLKNPNTSQKDYTHNFDINRYIQLTQIDVKQDLEEITVDHLSKLCISLVNHCEINDESSVANITDYIVERLHLDLECILNCIENSESSDFELRGKKKRDILIRLCEFIKKANFTGPFSFINESLISSIASVLMSNLEIASSLTNQPHIEKTMNVFFILKSFNIFRQSLPTCMSNSIGILDAITEIRQKKIDYLTHILHDAMQVFGQQPDTYPIPFQDNFIVQLKNFAKTFFIGITDKVEVEFFVELRKFSFIFNLDEDASCTSDEALHLWTSFGTSIDKFIQHHRSEDKMLKRTGHRFDDLSILADSLIVIKRGIVFLTQFFSEPKKMMDPSNHKLIYTILTVSRKLIFSYFNFSHFSISNELLSSTNRLINMYIVTISRMIEYFTPQDIIFADIVPFQSFIANKEFVQDQIFVILSLFKYLDRIVDKIICSINSANVNSYGYVVHLAESLVELTSLENLEFNDSIRLELIETTIHDFLIHLTSTECNSERIVLERELGTLIKYKNRLTSLSIELTLELAASARNRKFRVPCSTEYLRHLFTLIQRLTEIDFNDAKSVVLQLTKKFEVNQARMKVIGHALMLLRLYIPNYNPEMVFLETSANKIIKTLYWQDRFKIMEISFNLSHDHNYVVKAIGRLIRMVPCPLQPNFSICLSRDGIIRYESSTVLVPHVELSLFMRLQESYPQIEESLEKALLIRLSHLLESRLDQQLAASGMNLDSALEGTNDGDLTLVDLENEVAESNEGPLNITEYGQLISSKYHALLSKQRNHFPAYIATIIRQSTEIIHSIQKASLFPKIKESLLNTLPKIHSCDYELRLFICTILQDYYAVPQPIDLIKALKNYKRTKPISIKMNSSAYIHPLQHERISFIEFNQKPREYISREVNMKNLEFWLETNCYLNSPLNEDAIIFACASNILREFPMRMEIFNFDEAGRIESEEYIDKFVNPIFTLINKVSDKKKAIHFLEEEFLTRSVDPYIQMEFLCQFEKRLFQWKKMNETNFDLSLNLTVDPADAKEEKNDFELSKADIENRPDPQHADENEVSMNLDLDEESSGENRRKSDVDINTADNEDDVFEEFEAEKMTSDSGKVKKGCIKDSSENKESPKFKTPTVRFNISESKKRYSMFSNNSTSFSNSFFEMKISEIRDRLKIVIIHIILRQLDLLFLWPSQTSQSSFKRVEDLLSHCLVEISHELIQSSTVQTNSQFRKKNISNFYRFKILDSFYELMTRIHNVPRMFSLSCWIASELVHRLRLASTKADAIKVTAILKPICRFWSSKSEVNESMNESLYQEKDSSDDLYNEYDFDTELLGDQLSESILNHTHMPENAAAESNAKYRQRLSMAVLDNSADIADTMNISLNNTVANFMKKFQSKSSIKVSKVDQGMDQHGPCKVDQVSVQILLKLVSEKRKEEWINIISSGVNDDKENMYEDPIGEENRIRLGMSLVRTWGVQSLEHEELLKSLLPEQNSIISFIE